MATTGEKLAGLGETVSENPYDDFTWTNPTNIYSDNAANASVTSNSFDSGTITYVLKASNFDFSAIPDGAAITGVIVKVNCYYTDGAVNMTLCQLLGMDHAKVGTNHASSPVALSTGTGTVLTEGASGDTWGNALTAAWVKDVDFGVALGFTSAGTNSEVRVDYVSMEVEYQAINGIDTTIKVNSSLMLWVAPFLLSSVVLREGAGINPATIIRLAETFSINVPVVDTSVNINAIELTIKVAEAAPTIHPDPLQIYGIDTPIKVLSTTSVQADNILAYVIEGLKVAEQFSSWFDLFNFNRIDLTIKVADSATIQVDNRLLNVSDTTIVPSDTIEFFLPELNVSPEATGIGIGESAILFRGELVLPVSDLKISVADSATLFLPSLNLPETELKITVAEETTVFRPELVLPVIELTIGVKEQIQKEVGAPFIGELSVSGEDETIGVADSGEIQPTELHLSVAEGIGVSDTGEIKPTELHLDVSQPVVVSESSALFLPELVLPVAEAVGVAESVTIQGSTVPVSGSDGLAIGENSGVNPATIIRVAEEFTIDVGEPSAPTINAIELTITVAETTSIRPTELHISGSDAIGISDYSATVVKYCIFIRESCAIATSILNISVAEGIGVAESSTEFFENVNLLGIDKTITVAETSALQREYVPISVAEAISVADTGTLGAGWDPWCLDAATITEQALIQSFHFLEVAEAIGVSDWGDAGYWNVWLLDAATIAEQGQIFVEDVWLETINPSEGILVSESAAIAPTELHISVAEGIGIAESRAFQMGYLFISGEDTSITVADSGEIQPTELHVAPEDKSPILVTESTEIFRPSLVAPEVELTITVAEDSTVHVAAVQISGSDAVAVTDSALLFWNVLNVPEGEGVGVTEIAQIHVTGTIYTPIDLNFPLEDNLTVAEEITLLRPTIFITATELTIGIHETETTWMAERNVPGTEKTITVSESATIEKQGFGRLHVIWVEPHNRIIDVKPKHRKHWVDTQPREV